MTNDTMTRTELANQHAAAAYAHLQLTGSACAIAAIPDTEPQLYAAVGTPETIAAILPATISPQRRMKHGDRPSADDLDWNDATDRAAEAAQPASTDLQQIKALALAYENENRWWYTSHQIADGITDEVAANFIAAVSPAVVLDLIARIEHEREVAASWKRTAEKKDADWNAERMARVNERCAARAASPATASGDDLPTVLDERRAFSEWFNGTMYRTDAEEAMCIGWQARAAVSAATKPTDSSELEFNATRLRNVARLVGLEKSIPEDDATLDGARGSVLGMIAGALRNAATKPAAAQAVPEVVREALDIAHDLAVAEADRVHETYKGYKQHKHDAADRDVETVKRAIDALAAAPASAEAVIQAREQAIEECWSRDEENFSYQSLDDLLSTHDDLKPGDRVWLADAVRPDPNRLIDADDVTTTMGERAYDIAGEHAEDYPDVSTEAEGELNALLAAWINKNCAPTFWGVENVRPYVLSADDFPNDPTPMHAEFGTPAAGTEGAA